MAKYAISYSPSWPWRNVTSLEVTGWIILLKRYAVSHTYLFTQDFLMEASSHCIRATALAPTLPLPVLVCHHFHSIRPVLKLKQDELDLGKDSPDPSYPSSSIQRFRHHHPI